MNTFIIPIWVYAVNNYVVCVQACVTVQMTTMDLENYQSPTWQRSTIKIMVDTEWAALEEVPFSDGLTRRWSQINSTFYISQNDINVYMTYYRLEHILMFLEDIEKCMVGMWMLKSWLNVHYKSNSYNTEKELYRQRNSYFKLPAPSYS